MKRYVILAACVAVLVCLGTGQAWSVFAGPLSKEYGFTTSQNQFIFFTMTIVFCFLLIPAGRLHDRLGPRPLVVASAVLVGGAWTLASFFGSHYFVLWLAMGVLFGTGAAVGYVCPIATAVKWFPRNRGLISGLAAAGYAGGPVILSALSELLLARGWHVLEIFRLVGMTYAPIILLLGLLLAVPPGRSMTIEIDGFRRGKLMRDRNFWTLFVGMFCGTLPFLILMGNVKPIGLNFGIGEAAVLAIAVMALGNASGRVFWGHFIDRLGPRRSMLSAQALMVVSMTCLVLFGGCHPWFFLAAACGVGFCYGSNFAIYPASVAGLYGTHVLGTVYPLIMAAQGIAGCAPALNGWLFDVTGSYIPGLSIGVGVAVAGIIATFFLSRTLDGHAGKVPPECA